MTARLKTPPSTLQLATRGLRLCQTGWGEDQFDITSEVWCWPGRTTSKCAAGGYFTYWFCSR